MTVNPEIAYPLAAGGAMFLLAWLVAGSLTRAKRKTTGVPWRRVETASPFLRLLRPAAQCAGHLLRMTAMRLEARLGRDSRRSLLLSLRLRAERALSAAGYPEDLTADEFLGLVIVFALLGLLVGMGGYTYISLGIVPLAGLLLGGAAPVLKLRGLIRRRQRDIRHMLPYALDLLTLSVEAGLDFTEAMRRIVHRIEGSPLAAELGETLRQVQLGKSRGEALRELARRVDIPELRSIVNALIQTDELGGNLGPVLRAQAEQLRNMRSQEAEKKAMEAPVKILFPLILFIFPTIFLMMFGPIVLQFMNR